MRSRSALLTSLLVASPLAALAAVPAPPAPRTGGAVEWTEAPLEDVLARARDEGRLVLVELVTEWELDCDRLRTSLEHETVVPALEGLLCVRVDAERGEGPCSPSATASAPIRRCCSSSRTAACASG